MFARFAVFTALALALATRPDPVAAQNVELLSSPAEAESGAPFPAPLRARFLDAQLRPRVGVTVSVSASAGRLIGPTSAATDSAGTVTFEGLGVRGVAGTTVSVRLAAPGAERSTDVLIRPGAPAALSVVRTPTGSVARQAIDTAFVVRLEDAEGNQVRRSGVAVLAALGAGGGELSGTTTVATSSDGTADFRGLVITGRPGTRTIRFSSEALRSVDSEPHFVDHAAFDSHLIIGAVETISGVEPGGELFDLSFVFPLIMGENRPWYVPLVFSLATIDLPLTRGQVERAGGTPASGADSEGGSPVSNSSVQLNLAYDNDPNSGARKLYFGASAQTFDGDFYVGGHVGSLELPSSALHGSNLQFGFLGRVHNVEQYLTDADGTVRENPKTKNNIFSAFLLRSDDLPLISTLNIRGFLIVPFGRKTTDIRMRIALSVPFADIAQISSGS